MEYVTHRISLDVHATQSQVTLRVKRGDTKRKIYISLCEGSSPYEIAAGCTAALSAIKPDGNSILNNCEIKDNKIIYTFTGQTTPKAGIFDCDIILKDSDGTQITAPHFTIIVEEGNFVGDEIASTPEATLLTELFDRTNSVISDAVSRTDEAIGRADEAIDDINVQTGEAIRDVERQTRDAINDIKSQTNEAIGDVKSQTNEATNRVNGVIDNINTTFANAFKGSKSGAAVQLDDVSPVEHTVKVKASGDINPTEVKLTRCGKNLVTNLGSSIEGTGIEWTLNDDGSVTANGTAETRCVYNFAVIHSNSSLVDEIVTLSGCPSGGSKDTYCIYQRNYGQYDTGNAKTFTIYNDNFTAWGIQIEQGVTVSDLVFKPQLELGSVATEFEKSYIESGMIFNDGVCEVASVYPVMTLLTNAKNVVIDCEYNRDSNKVYEELYDFLEQGGLTGPAARIANVKLLASAWTGTASPYSQVVTINGVTPNTQVDLTPSAAQLAIFHNKDLAFVTENENGVVTVYAIGQKPTNDYTIQATLTEVMI